MSTHALPAVLSVEDRERIERRLAELPDTSDGPVTLSVFLPAAGHAMVILAQEGDIISWCLMPARNQGHASDLSALLKEVLRRELDIACTHVKAVADALIARASRAIPERQSPGRAPRRRNDIPTGEWDAGAV